MRERISSTLQRWGQTGLALVGLVCSVLVGAPVAFGMANEVSTTTLSNADATEYIAEKTLRVALYELATYQFAEKHKLNPGEGRTFQLNRYEHLTLPQAPITQGVTPDNTALSVSKVTATAEQWGAVITMYDVPILTIKHPILQKAIGLLGVQAAKVFEREMQRALMSATNVQFINSRVSRTTLAAGDVLNSLEIRKAVSNLRKNGAARWTRNASNTPKSYIDRMLDSGGGTQGAKPGLSATSYQGFIGIVDTDVAQDIQSDATFVNAAAYSNIRALHVGEIGMWLRVVWIESNFMPNITLLTSPTCATANMSGMSGGLTASTAYDVYVTRLSTSYGLEEAVSAKIDVSTDGSGDAISVILPAGDTYKYRVYLGTDAGTCYEVLTAATGTAATADSLSAPYAANQTIYLTSIATSGNTAPTPPASGVTVHVTWVFGAEAFGCVELDRLQATLTQNQASDSDPLMQRRKAGWKTMFKGVVQNHNFIRKIESASNFAG